MTDYKDLAYMASSGLYFGDAASADILALIAENQSLLSKIEFHERNAKIMEGALLAAEKRADSRIQRINQLENRLEHVRAGLGSFSYIVDYPDEGTADKLNEIYENSERYRFLKYLPDDQYLIERLECATDPEDWDSVIDSAMGKEKPGD